MNIVKDSLFQSLLTFDPQYFLIDNQGRGLHCHRGRKRVQEILSIKMIKEKLQNLRKGYTTVKRQQHNTQLLHLGYLARLSL